MLAAARRYSSRLALVGGSAISAVACGWLALTGVASGMNTVLRTLGGAVGGQIAATLVVGHTSGTLPQLTGFTETFGLAALLLLVCVLAGLLVPRQQHQAITEPADVIIAA